MRASALTFVVGFAFAVVAAQSAAASDEAPAAKVKSPAFTKAYLDDAKNQKAGEELWQDQCRHCHGASAYPGKAPKLKPYRYKPDFVFDRVANGFRKMPAWAEVYSKEEIMALVAFILSDDFSP